MPCHSVAVQARRGVHAPLLYNVVSHDPYTLAGYYFAVNLKDPHFLLVSRVCVGHRLCACARRPCTATRQQWRVVSAPDPAPRAPPRKCAEARPRARGGVPAIGKTVGTHSAGAQTRLRFAERSYTRALALAPRGAAPPAAPPAARCIKRNVPGIPEQAKRCMAHMTRQRRGRGCER